MVIPLPRETEHANDVDRSLTATLLSAMPLLAQRPDGKVLGEVDFFGSKGIDVAAIRSALPFREGEPFPPPEVHSDPLKRQVSDRVKEITGRPATDVAFICCDSKQNYLTYIGLQGASYQELRFDPAPRGSIRLPKAAMTLGDRMGDAWAKAVMSGHAEEDDSAGYALTRDPEARKAELAVRDYALANEQLILKVLASSSNAEHRANAAVMVGYGRQSNEQIDALVRASLDPDGDVRNNAVRALEVLAGAKPGLASRIPIAPFVRLLRSGAWTDHNKASLLLVALTAHRDPRVLSALRSEALDPLIEMARWQYEGHAEAAITILGRIAGLDETTIIKMIEAGEKEQIIARATQNPGSDDRHLNHPSSAPNDKAA
jgi:hypothetical protein